DPRPGRRRPIDGKLAAWSLAPDAVTADALSTAFMIMTSDEVEAFCVNHPGTAALVLDPSPPDTDGPPQPLRHGAWPAESP
ncbi:MAG: FAD:protein FMN transferase, partial [Phycisphaeraceae bacterium]